MKKTSVAVVLAVLIFLGLWGYRDSRAASEAPSAGPSIGVVNVNKILMECQENIDRENKMRQRTQEVKAKLDELAAKADALGQELQQALQPGTAEYDQALQDYYNTRALYEAYREGRKKAMADDARMWVKQLYQRLLEQVAKVALQEGYWLVLNLDATPLQGDELANLSAQIVNRKVLYNLPRLDITAKVLRGMDGQYEASRSSTVTKP